MDKNIKIEKIIGRQIIDSSRKRGPRQRIAPDRKRGQHQNSLGQ